MVRDSRGLIGDCEIGAGVRGPASSTRISLLVRSYAPQREGSRRLGSFPYPGAVASFAAAIDAPGLRRPSSAGESHAGMAHGPDGLDSLTTLQFEPGRGVYQGD